MASVVKSASNKIRSGESRENSSSCRVKTGLSSINHQRGSQFSTSNHLSDSRNKSLTATVKTEVMEKGSSSSHKKVNVKEKKTYSLPGQKYDVPEEREPLRIFYESLSRQIPSSEMAEIWLMEHGLLSPERAKKALERRQKKQKSSRMGTPMRTPSSGISLKTEISDVSKKPSISRIENNKLTKRGLDFRDDDVPIMLKATKVRV